jgi:vitamin B12 transporter
MLLGGTAAAALLGTGTPLSAQAVIELDEITVTANRTETDAERTGSTVEIVEEAQIESAPVATVAEVLAFEPGVSVSASGGLGQASQLRVRGLAGAYLAVRVDGIDVSDPSGTQTYFDFGQLTTGAVSKLELLKGSQSALYGSEAITGVLDITSNRPTEDGVTHEITAEAGSYATYRQGYNVAIRDGGTELAFSINHAISDGFSAADENDGNDERDGYEATRLSFYGAHQLTDTVRIGIAGFLQDTTYDYDEGAGEGGDGSTDDVTTADSNGVRLFAEIQGDAIEHDLSVSRYEIDRDLTGSNGWGAFAFDYLGTREELAYKGVAQISPELELVFGADRTEETIESNGVEEDRSTTGVYAQALWAPRSDLDLSLSLRRDDTSDFGAATTGRLAAAWRPADDLILRAAYGTGFRAPSLYELYGDFVGNEDLEAERSESFELGVEKRFANDGFVRATAFRTEIDDLIIYDTSVYAYNQVEGRTTIEGLELSGGVAITPTVELLANYTYTETEDRDGDRLARVPRHDLTLGLDAALNDRVNGRVTVTHNADVVDAVSGGLEPLDDWTRVDAQITYDITDSAEAYLRVENLLDEEYQTITGYGTSDRAVYVGLRAAF